MKYSKITVAKINTKLNTKYINRELLKYTKIIVAKIRTIYSTKYIVILNRKGTPTQTWSCQDCRTAKCQQNAKYQIFNMLQRSYLEEAVSMKIQLEVRRVLGHPGFEGEMTKG